MTCACMSHLTVFECMRLVSTMTSFFLKVDSSNSTLFPIKLSYSFCTNQPINVSKIAGNI